MQDRDNNSIAGRYPPYDVRVMRPRPRVEQTVIAIRRKVRGVIVTHEGLQFIHATVRANILGAGKRNGKEYLEIEQVKRHLRSRINSP